MMQGWRLRRMPCRLDAVQRSREGCIGACVPNSRRAASGIRPTNTHTHTRQSWSMCGSTSKRFRYTKERLDLCIEQKLATYEDHDLSTTRNKAEKHASWP
jgi:hypothetical protein